MRKFVALGALAAMAAGTQAVAADGLSYTLAEGRFFSEPYWDQFGVSGSFAFTPDFFGLGSIETVVFDNTFTDNYFLSLGAGYHRAITQALDVFATASLKRTAVVGFRDFSGFGLGVGVRGRMSKKLELNAGLEYEDITKGVTRLQFGGRWYFTKAFAAGLDLLEHDSDSVLRFAARYDFAPR